MPTTITAPTTAPTNTKARAEQWEKLLAHYIVKLDRMAWVRSHFDALSCKSINNSQRALWRAQENIRKFNNLNGYPTEHGL